MNRTDVIILIFIVLLSGLIAFFTLTPKEEKSGVDKYVSIQVNGKEVERKPLLLSTVEEIEVQGYSGENHILIENGKVNMIEADCPDQICVHTPPIEKVGERIICLPNRVMVEIKSETHERVIDATVF